MELSDIPIGSPLVAPVLVEALMAAGDEYEKAFPTPFTHSMATKCQRWLAYKALGLAESDPMDPAGHWVTWQGKELHKAFQEALLAKWPDASVEVKVKHGTLSSGSVDFYIPELDGVGSVAGEIKRRGSYAFDKSIGLNRRAYKLGEPAGPGLATKMQGALNALALKADRLVIIAFSAEAVSKQLAEQLDFSDFARIMAEWHYRKDEYEPWAKWELERFEGVKQMVDRGRLPDRIGVDDDGNRWELNPDASKPPWLCMYCGYLSACKRQGPGVIIQ